MMLISIRLALQVWKLCNLGVLQGGTLSRGLSHAQQRVSLCSQCWSGPDLPVYLGFPIKSSPGGGGNLVASSVVLNHDSGYSEIRQDGVGTLPRLRTF